jgi:hypothetical protein
MPARKLEAVDEVVDAELVHMTKPNAANAANEDVVAKYLRGIFV